MKNWQYQLRSNFTRIKHRTFKACAKQCYNYGMEKLSDLSFSVKSLTTDEAMWHIEYKAFYYLIDGKILDTMEID